MSVTRPLESYVAGLAVRRREARERAARWQAAASQEARDVALMLAREYGAVRVLMFGSVARGEGRPGGDVDLLVEGIPPERWFEACGQADSLARAARPDLVPWRSCRPEVLERALAEGVLLHG